MKGRDRRGRFAPLRVANCAACGLVERPWRALGAEGWCEHCRRDAARGANMTPVQDAGAPPLRKKGKRLEPLRVTRW